MVASSVSMKTPASDPLPMKSKPQYITVLSMISSLEPFWAWNVYSQPKGVVVITVLSLIRRVPPSSIMIPNSPENPEFILMMESSRVRRAPDWTHMVPLTVKSSLVKVSAPLMIQSPLTGGWALAFWDAMDRTSTNANPASNTRPRVFSFMERPLPNGSIKH